jgi:glycosyltransferase involved in cell wall biosynthesis
MPEIVADEETGLLVPSGDRAAIAQAMAALAGDPERARRMGERARARQREFLTWDAVAGRIHAAVVDRLLIPASRAPTLGR